MFYYFMLVFMAVCYRVGLKILESIQRIFLTGSLSSVKTSRFPACATLQLLASLEG